MSWRWGQSMKETEGNSLTGRTGWDMVINIYDHIKTWPKHKLIRAGVAAAILGIVLIVFMYVHVYLTGMISGNYYPYHEDRVGNPTVLEEQDALGLQSKLDGAEREIVELRQQLELFKDKSSDSTSALSAIKVERETLVRRMHAMEVELASANMKLAEAATNTSSYDFDKIKSLEKLKASLEAERVELKRRLLIEEEALAATKLALQNALRRDATQRSTNEKIISELKQEVSVLGQRLKKLQTEGRRLGLSNTEALSDRAELQRQLTEASNSASHWMSKHSEVESRVSSLEIELSRARENLAKDQSTTITTAIWGAAAASPDGSFFGIANQTSERVAADNVLLLCRGASNKRCTLKHVFHNSCFAIARKVGEGARPDNWAYDVAASWQLAEQNAMAACSSIHRSSCNVRFISCSPAGLDKPSVQFPD